MLSKTTEYMVSSIQIGYNFIFPHPMPNDENFPPTFAVSTLASSVWSTPSFCPHILPLPVSIRRHMLELIQCMCGAVGLGL